MPGPLDPSESAPIPRKAFPQPPYPTTTYRGFLAEHPVLGLDEFALDYTLHEEVEVEGVLVVPDGGEADDHVGCDLGRRWTRNRKVLHRAVLHMR